MVSSIIDERKWSVVDVSEIGASLSPVYAKLLRRLARLSTTVIQDFHSKPIYPEYHSWSTLWHT